MRTIFIIAIAIFFAIPSNVQAQDINGRQFGVNFRNVWFGNTLEILHRRQMEADRWRRIDAFVAPSMNSSSIGESLNGVTVPNDFRTQTFNTFNGGVQMVREQFVNLSEGFDFYHGRAFAIGYYNTNSRRTTSGQFGTVVYQTQMTQNITLGLGYLAGVRYDVNSRFAVGLDTDLKFQMRVTINDNETKIYDDATKIISPGTELKPLYSSGFSLSGGPVTRIWLLFNIK